ncbi:MAG TPA: integrase family protein, partial [Allosphingosinicella sp.]|nr:integrase family protein [Allosphingosinicella sp.]
MPKTKLNATFCLTAVCEPQKRKTDYWDTIISGFVLEVRSTGGKTYYLRYFDQNERQRQLKLGGYADISFDQARKKAKKLRSEVVLGGDPLSDKEERKAISTYSALAEQHLAYAKAHLRSHSSTETNLRVHILPRWGKLRLNEIKPQDISAWLAEKAKDGLKPATVEKIRILFGRSFELGRRWVLPGCENNPVRAVPRAKFNNARERFLTASEAARLLKACDESLNPQLG